MPTLPAPAYPVAPAVYLPPLHNLVASAVPVPDEPGSRWELGFVVEPEGWALPVAAPGAWCGTDYIAANGLKPVEAPPDTEFYQPFQIVTSYSCKMGRAGDERRDKARRQLLGGQSKAVEQELWTATQQPTNMALAVRGTGGGGALTATDKEVIRNPGYDTALAPSTATPVDLSTGVAILSQALADYGPGSKGMLHMDATVGTVAAEREVVVEDGRGANSVLRTRARGDIAVVGAGYPGTGPGGHDPVFGQAWVHATSMVQLRLGVVVILPGTDREAVNRATGEWTVYAEQTAAAYWDGRFQASVLVDLSLASGSSMGA